MYSKSYTVSGTESYYEPTRYIYDLNTEYSQVLAEYGGTGAPRDTYVYGADGRTSHNDTEQYIYDGRGSVSEVVADGIVKNTLRYDPFGKILQGEPKQDRIYGYNGEQYTPQTGLIYLRARNYNPETGTFTSQDTYLGSSTNAASRNRYAYGLNDPVTYQDPSGHISINGIWNKIQQTASNKVAKWVSSSVVGSGAVAGVVAGAKAASAASKKTTTASTKKATSTSSTSRTSTATRSSSSTSSTRNAGTNAIVSSIGKVTTAVNSPSYASTSSSARSTSSSSGSGGSSYTGSAPINYSSTLYNIMGPTLKYNLSNTPYVKYPEFPIKVDEDRIKELEEMNKKYMDSMPAFPTMGQVHEINYNPNLTVSSVKEKDDWWDKTLDVLGTVGMIVTDVAVIAGAIVLAPEAAVAGVVALVAVGLVALVDGIFRGFDLGEIFTGKNKLKDSIGEEAYETTETVTGAVSEIAATAIGFVNVNKVTTAGSIIGKGGTVAKEVFEEGAETFVEKNVDEVAEGILKSGNGSNKNVFPDNPDDFLPEIPRDTVTRPNGTVSQTIYPSDQIRIRAEQHPMLPDEIFNPRHHGTHYHVEYRLDSSISWNNSKNVNKLYPDEYILGEGTGFLPGELFP